MEIWKDIPGHENIYQISNEGRVKALPKVIYRNGGNSTLKEKILIGGKYSNGYRFVSLRKNGENKNHLIHRLVAISFIPNINDYLVVNHLDGDKSNNKINNLEWCTQGQNLKHAVKIGLIKSQCKIARKVILTKENTTDIVFNNMAECAKHFGFKKSWLPSRRNKYGEHIKYDGYTIKICERGSGF